MSKTDKPAKNEAQAFTPDWIALTAGVLLMVVVLAYTVIVSLI